MSNRLPLVLVLCLPFALNQRSAAQTCNPGNADPSVTICMPTAGGTLPSPLHLPIATNDFWVSKPVMSFSRSDDTAAQVYWQATLTAASGYELNLDNFTFDGARLVLRRCPRFGLGQILHLAHRSPGLPLRAA